MKRGKVDDIAESNLSVNPARHSEKVNKGKSHKFWENNSQTTRCWVGPCHPP